VGIEKQGYVQGGIFVLSPTMEKDWMEALGQPLPTQEHVMTASGRLARTKRVATDGNTRAFTGLKLKAEYKGYGPWRVSKSECDAFSCGSQSSNDFV
jgi:hypothetical protein